MLLSMIILFVLRNTNTTPVGIPSVFSPTSKLVFTLPFGRKFILWQPLLIPSQAGKPPPVPFIAIGLKTRPLKRNTVPLPLPSQKENNEPSLPPPTFLPLPTPSPLLRHLLSK